MKTFGKIICLCGILIFKVLLCSAADGLSEADLKKLYKLSDAKGDIIVTKNYKIIKGEIIKEPTKKIWMKIENPEDDTKKLTEGMSKLAISEAAGNKAKTESSVSHEIKVFKDLKKGKKDLLGECVADMLDHGTYEKKKVLIIPGLGKNLKEYSSKPYSWDDLSKIGPCMIKALRLLHSRNYVHRNLKPEIFAFGTQKNKTHVFGETKPEVFAFGTEEKVVPLKNQVYLFDVGYAEKYTDSNGKHKPSAKIKEFVGDIIYASRAAMENMTLSRRDDIESLHYVLAFLAGLTKKFDRKQPEDVLGRKFDFSSNQAYMKKTFEKSNITDARVLYGFADYIDDMIDLFTTRDDVKEPAYDDLISCFDQGLSEEEIKAKYNFVSSKIPGSSLSFFGNTTDPSNKTEVAMKLMKTDVSSTKQMSYSLSFKIETRVYKDLKKGMKYSLFRENVWEMLDYGVYDKRRAIIIPRPGLDWHEVVNGEFAHGYPYELLCNAARQAISALRFVHKKGYLHQDVTLENFAFGTVDAKKNDKSQADKPLKNRLYLFDFRYATKWRDANNKHIPRGKTLEGVGTEPYMCRNAIMKNTQSRRDEMESLMLSSGIAATGRFIFDVDEKDDKNPMTMWKKRNDFITKPGEITDRFNGYEITDKRVHKAFIDYAAELNKLFKSDDPAHFEKEPDYNAFCACFGGKPGDKACAVE